MNRGKMNITATLLALLVSAGFANGETIRGTVTDAGGRPMGGVMVSAHDTERKQSVSVFSQADGSFAIDGLRKITFKLRARLMGQRDLWVEDVDAGAKNVALLEQRQNIL